MKKIMPAIPAGRKNRISKDKKKCESCKSVKLHSNHTLPWNRENHWMYDKDLKGVALYLLMVGKHPDNIFSKLGKDVWLIIMRHVLIPNYFLPDCSMKNQYAYCDDCMRDIYQSQPCQYCDKNGIISPCVYPDVKYKWVKHLFIEEPAMCSKCRARLYICELHKTNPPFQLCYKCDHARDIKGYFNSSFWINLQFMTNVGIKI